MQKQKIFKILPFLILGTMILLSFFAVQNDSATMDEVAHIPAGYSYLKFQDYRLNPEHPPLLKILATFPLLFLDLKFPLEHPTWTQAINGQWEAGYQFLYHLGNNADQILFWSRLPVIALLILAGFFFWRWARELLGEKWACVALFIFAFSPTLIAHSHYVTTDLGATTFIFIAFYYFAHYLQKPTKGGMVKAGIALGFAHLAKFSSVLLLPTYALLIFIPLFLTKNKKTSWRKQCSRFCGHYLAMLAISFLVAVIFYVPLVWHFPLAKQQELIRAAVNPVMIENILLKISALPGGRAATQYLLGLVMVFVRVGGGNTNYFLGRVSNQGWFFYFPICFLLKETISVLILTGLGISYPLRKFWHHLRTVPRHAWPQWFKKYSTTHIPEILMVLFILIYGLVSMKGKLNIGIRHIMVIFPLIYILIVQQFAQRFQESKRRTGLKILLAVLLVWVFFEITMIYPSYLAYYNELIGGPTNGYKYITDSNLDWGQDLKRLTQWVEANNIPKIKVDYFGGGVPAYYLGDRYEEWHAEWGRATGWIAVSATYLSESNYRPQATAENSYYYLENLEPFAKIGYSIFVYYVPAQ